MSVRRLTLALALGSTAAAGSAHAEWLRATSPHFIVYADTSEDALRRRSAELEQFDALIRSFHRMQANADDLFNRVTVYVLPSVQAVQKLGRIKNAYGFYIPRVTGSVAFTPQSGDSGPFALSPKKVLFHEYAHHFLMGNYAVAYPAWFNEGYAEFVSTAMQKDGSLWIGASANHRAHALINGKPLSIEQMFQPPATLTGAQRGALYGRGWLLTHLIMFNDARRQQFGRYLELLNGGKPSLEAAGEAFGDLKALDRDLDAYLNRRMLPAKRIDPATLPAAPVEIRALSAGEAALMPMRIESERGVNRTTAAPLFARAQAAAAAYPKDAVAQAWLAEMAFDARQYDVAEAAADAALAVDPDQGEALLLKARIHLRGAVDARATDPKVWTEARTWIAKANRASNNDAAALALFYRSFMMQRQKPTANAAAAIYRANQIVPQDQGVRFLAARQMLVDGRTESARQLLRILAASPHAPPDNPASRLLARIDAGQAGQAADALGQAAADSEANGKSGNGTGDRIGGSAPD